MNYYKRYPGDYMRDTAHLSLIEHGAYTMLLDTYYATGRPLPTDRGGLYRICRAFSSTERKAVDSVVEQFFVVDGDLLRNARADSELEADARRIDMARLNGSKGGRRAKDNPTLNPPETQTEPSGFPKETEPEPSGQALQHQHQRTTSQGDSLRSPPEPEKLVLLAEKQPQGKELRHADPSQLNPGNTRTRVANSGPNSAGAWDAYATAYGLRYAVDPVRNAKVNGQLAQLVKRLGAEEAPQVAAFYLRHNGALYVRSKHCVDLLLRDCEGLRTEWASGRTVTDAQARQEDRRQTTANAFAPLLAEAQARKANG